MIVILTKKFAYFYDRKGIRFYLRILICKLKNEEYGVVDL